MIENKIFLIKQYLMGAVFSSLLIFPIARDILAQSTHSLRNDSRPNILLILADDQGYHDVSYYGTKDLKTPNIDKIAHAGMRFDNFYATPVCAPSRPICYRGDTLVLWASLDS